MSPSEVETRRFGVLIARLEAVDADAFEGAWSSCRESGVQMLIVRCNTSDVALAQAVEDKGGRLMDTLVYYRRALGGGGLPAELKSNTVEDAGPLDAPALQELVSAVFSGYRGHYHADPFLDRASCDAGYAEWALTMLSNQAGGNHVFVSRALDGVLDGFAAMRMNSSSESEGVLFGVHPHAGGRGLYWSFMVRSLEWSRSQGAHRMIVSTQITNLAVQKQWVRMGFEPFRSQYTFHLWFPQS